MKMGKGFFVRLILAFPLLVEITHQAMVKMELEVGNQVFCLFKTSSMKILSIGN